MNQIPENIGQFYLGNEIQPEQRPLLYDAADLCTHAVIIGMTGSGKTGLGISLLEEAALDNIPVIAIDPKGDLGNLLLNFPRLQAEDFLPYADANVLAQQGIDAPTWAENTAEQWRQGIEQSGQSSERMQMLKAGNPVHLYTPGSSLGLPLALIGDFPPPPAEIQTNREAYADYLDSSAASLLALLKQDNDSLSPAHVFLTHIFNHFWTQQQSIDLGGLIAAISRPPFEKIGILPLSQVFPEKSRQSLALGLNNLLAAPGFTQWHSGKALDCESLFYRPEKRAQTSILNIAHLSDSERMYFVSLLLAKLIAWMRRQQGTSTLRAILYMDEIAGYLPPNSNPASKAAFLTLLKQARAFGLGLVLSTQNPIDLDYKALSNAGTWFIGRLQTAQDRKRLREGLLSAGEAGLNAAELDQWFDQLGKRQFLMKNIHENAPCILQTRWAMSYLAGPLGAEHIRRLSQSTDGADKTSEDKHPHSAHDSPALLPNGIATYYAPGGKNGAPAHYFPTLLAAATLFYQDTKADIRTENKILLNVALEENGDIDWTQAAPLALNLEQLQSSPTQPAHFHPAPPSLGDSKCWTAWERSLKTALRQFKSLEIFYAPDFKIYSEAGESEQTFRNRLSTAAHEQRDQAVQKLRQSYNSKQMRLARRQISAEQALERENAQASNSLLSTGIAIGGALLGAFTGRKVLSQSNINRAAGAIRKAGNIGKERQDLAAAKEKAALIEQEIAALEQELAQALADIEYRYRVENLNIERKNIHAKAADIRIDFLALLYQPLA